MEKWREVYLRKIKTKAFRESGFLENFKAVLKEKNKTHKTIDKEVIGNQLLWYWKCLNDKSHVDYNASSHVKLNYKNVANHLLRNYFVQDDFEDSYLNLDCVKIEEDIISDRKRVILY